jgi:hypothetical protein
MSDDGTRAIILCAVSVSKIYQVSLADYNKKSAFSKFYSSTGVKLKPGYAHFIPVKDYVDTHPLTKKRVKVTMYPGEDMVECDLGYQAAPENEATYHELVVEDCSRCLPIAVVYFRQKPEDP